MQRWNGFADFAEINMIWTTERRRDWRFYPAGMKKGKKDDKKKCESGFGMQRSQ